jgi:hypothetical protein
MTETGLLNTVSELVAPGQGILAVDESVATISKRFAALGIDSTPESRRAYRETLLMCPGIGEFVSGAILYDETLRQTTSDGVAFPTAMRDAGIICGIKVVEGADVGGRIGLRLPFGGQRMRIGKGCDCTHRDSDGRCGVADGGNAVTGAFEGGHLTLEGTAPNSYSRNVLSRRSTAIHADHTGATPASTVEIEQRETRLELATLTLAR